MTALGKLLRTTAFRLTLVYLLVFALFAAFLLVYFAFNTRRLVTEQIASTVDAEIGGLAEQYNQGGIRRLVLVIEQRSRRPGSSLYLVTTPTGEGLAGNVGALAPGILDKPGWIETAYRRIEETETADTSRAGAGVHAAGRLSSAGRARSRRTRAHFRHRRGGRALVGGDRHHPRHRRRRLRHPPRAQARRRHDADGADHHGRRSVRPAAGRRLRRRTRSAGAQSQRHAGAHRGADARPQGSLRQRRA